MGNPDLEMIDIVDPATGVTTGRASRTEIHRDGLWHQVFHCLIVRPSTQSVILQERAQTKAAFPGKLDLSATGHLEAGERPIDGLRELHEELGVEVDPERVLSLGTRLLADHTGEGNRNHELVHLYLLADDRPLDEYSPDAAEVSGLVEVSAAGLLALLADREDEVDCSRWSAETGTRATTMKRTDLVADSDGYWAVLAVMAQRYLGGDRPLAI